MLVCVLLPGLNLRSIIMIIVLIMMSQISVHAADVKSVLRVFSWEVPARILVGSSCEGEGRPQGRANHCAATQGSYALCLGCQQIRNAHVSFRQQAGGASYDGV